MPCGTSAGVNYIENRFKLRAPEMTTEEFLDSLKQTDALTAKHKELLAEFLNLCDIVKFAKFGPSITEIEESFNSARRFVEETRPAEDSKEAR